MNAYQQTYYKTKVCQTFNIARSTLNTWIKRKEKTGSLLSEVHRIRGHSHTTDWEDFKRFVQTTPFDTLYELIEPFKLRYGKPIHYGMLRKGLKRIGWSHKKELPLQPSLPYRIGVYHWMLPKLIHQYGSDQILFVYESGINTTKVARYGWSYQSTRCKAWGIRSTDQLYRCSLPEFIL